MPYGKKNYCAMCYNLKPSLTIIMDDGDQYFKFFMSNFFYNATCFKYMDDN